MIPSTTLAPAAADRRRSSSAQPPPKSHTFPDFAQQHGGEYQLRGVSAVISRDPSPAALPNGSARGLHPNYRWAPREETMLSRWSRWASGGIGGFQLGRQKSLGEAIRTVRTRKASITENASEIAESLKAPVSLKLTMLCILWYTTSILTNASSKAILTALPRPVTLTIMQFFLVCFWCLFFSAIARRNAAVRNALPVLRNGIRRPSKDIIIATLPLTAFQIGGHILNSDAMSLIPVSLVHTIKGLSPLMTVLVYRFYHGIHYSTSTYLSLVPLTLGVIMACSASFKGNFVGLTYAFGSAILFVTQNIVSKKIFTEATIAEEDGTPIGLRKPDKLNLLCYSSGLAFLFTFPIWLWSEGFPLASDYFRDGTISLREKPDSLDHNALVAEFLVNGTFHFGQSLVAFVLLGLTSPVTYSVASLIKRVAVILFAIVWFGSPMTSVQGVGFGFTFLGLYLYDRTNDAAKADKYGRQRMEAERPLLPLSGADAKKSAASAFSLSPATTDDLAQSAAGAGACANGKASGSNSGSSAAHDGSHMNGVAISLPPGTKAEQTWTHNDLAGRPSAKVA